MLPIKKKGIVQKPPSISHISSERFGTYPFFHYLCRQISSAYGREKTVRVTMQSGSGLVLDRARRAFHPVWVKTEPDITRHDHRFVRSEKHPRYNVLRGIYRKSFKIKMGIIKKA